MQNIPVKGHFAQTLSSKQTHAHNQLLYWKHNVVNNYTAQYFPLAPDVGDPAWGQGTPFKPFLLPCPFTSSSFAFYYFLPFSFLIHFTYFLLLSIPSLSTRIVPLGFQVKGRRRQPNLGLVCFVNYCVICIA